MLVKRFREVSAGPKTDLSVFVPPFHDMLIFVNTGKTVIQVKFPEDRYQAYFVDWNQTLKVRSRECAAQWTHDCDGSNFYRYKTDGAYGHKGVLSRFFTFSPVSSSSSYCSNVFPGSGWRTTPGQPVQGIVENWRILAHWFILPSESGLHWKELSQRCNQTRITWECARDWCGLYTIGPELPPQ